MRRAPFFIESNPWWEEYLLSLWQFFHKTIAAVHSGPSHNASDFFNFELISSWYRLHPPALFLLHQCVCAIALCAWSNLSWLNHAVSPPLIRVGFLLVLAKIYLYFCWLYISSFSSLQMVMITENLFWSRFFHGIFSCWPPPSLEYTFFTLRAEVISFLYIYESDISPWTICKGNSTQLCCWLHIIFRYSK